MATVFVPQIQQQATLFADFKFQLTIVIFLLLNGHHVVLQALFLSFRDIPLDGWPHFAHGFWPLFHMVIRMTADMLIVAVALAAPAAIATFLTDLALGLINRVVPQIQVSSSACRSSDDRRGDHPGCATVHLRALPRHVPGHAQPRAGAVFLVP
jgi:flagellar biosynthesis protein FliR